MSRVFIFLSILLMSSIAQGSTFIGNGGNMLDPPLRLTRSAMSAALQHAKDYPSEVCTCNGWSEQCALVKDINEDQRAFCAQFVIDHAQDLLKLLGPDGGLVHVWSDHDINDQKMHRQSDAIAQREKRRVILNESKFRELNQAGKLQLLTHEYVHFLTFDGKPIDDDGDIGPFKGLDGGRHFLDVIGAAVVLEAMRTRAVPIYETIYSSAFYKWRLGLASFNISYPKAFSKSAFLPEVMQKTVSSVTYFQRPSSNLGFTYRYAEQSEKSISSRGSGVTGEIQLHSHIVGLEWRSVLVPASRDSWVSNIHWGLFAGAGQGSVSHKIYDTMNNEIESKQLIAGQMDLSVYVPLRFGLQLQLGVGLDYTSYKLDQLGITSKSTNKNVIIGGSYGF